MEINLKQDYFDTNTKKGEDGGRGIKAKVLNTSEVGGIKGDGIKYM